MKQRDERDKDENLKIIIRVNEFCRPGFVCFSIFVRRKKILISKVWPDARAPIGREMYMVDVVVGCAGDGTDDDSGDDGSY